MSKKILFINSSWEQEALVKTIYDQGHDIVALSKTLPTYKKYLKKHIPCDESEISSIIKIAKLFEVECVISDNCDYSLLTSEIISDILDLPSLGIESARVSNNKYLQRVLCKKAAINQPKFELVESISNAIKFKDYISKPFLIKPLDSRGSIGITYLEKNSKSDQVGEAIASAIGASPSKKCLIEEYIDGELLTLDGFLLKGYCIPVAIAKRRRISNGLIVTNKIIYASNLDKKLIKKCITFLKDIAKSLNYFNGHIHCEVLLDKDQKLWLVECTNRGAGVFTSSTINPYVSGIDLNKLFLDIKLGKSIPRNNFEISEFSQRDASLIFPSLGKEGKLLYEYNLEKILKIKEVLAFKLFSKLGRPLASPTDGPSRHFALALSISNNDDIQTLIDYIIKNCFKIR